MTQIDNLAELMNDVESMSFLEGKVFCKKCNAPDHPDNMNALGLCMNCMANDLEQYSKKNLSYLQETKKTVEDLRSLKRNKNLILKK